MKIILKHPFSPIKIIFEGVTQHTTLGEIKRLYESISGNPNKRSQYNFMINNKKGDINDNTLLSFFDYLRLIHEIDTPPEMLDVYVVPNLDHQGIKKRENIKEVKKEIESQKDPEHPLICGLSYKVITGKPININGKFYDYENFLYYLLNEQSKFNNSFKSRINYRPVCPINQSLPPAIHEAITTGANIKSLDAALDDLYVISCEEFDIPIQKTTDELYTELQNKTCGLRKRK